MNTFLTQINSSIRSFVRDEEGAQIIEYALIVAVVSLGLILLIMAAGGLNFKDWIDRVNACLKGPTCV